MKYDFDQIIERRGTNTYKYGYMKDVCGRDDVIPMWVADMDFATPPFVIDTIQKRLSQQILGYTTPQEEYKTSIAQWCAGHYDWKIEPEHINYVPGVVCGIYLAMQAFTEKGDRILIQEPVYHPFRIVPQGNGREIVFNHLVRDKACNTFRIDFDALREDIKGCRMMILCNPHNPAGICWDRQTLCEIALICKQEGVIVVSDEIHCDMILDGRKHIPFASVSDEAREITITLQAPSKTFNMPGVVCSHAIVPNDNLRQKYFSYISESDMDLGNIFAFSCSVACYSEEGDEWRRQMLEYVNGNIELLIDGLKDYQDKIKVIRPQASFLVFLDCRGMQFSTQEECTRFFTEQCGLCLNPGEMFGPGGNQYMRLNVGCPRSTVQKAVGQITKAIRQTM